MTAESPRIVHFVSDSTGETVVRTARAALIQFDQISIKEYIWPFVHTPGQLEDTLSRITDNPGIVLYTLVGSDLRRQMIVCCERYGLAHVSILGPLTRQLETYFGEKRHAQPGKLHELNEAYFNRIDAVDFAVEHDDGAGMDSIHNAEVILLGVSRASKTPTCIYLAYRGVRAANYPLIPHVEIPDELKLILKEKKLLVVGLIQDANQLSHMRHNRLKYLADNVQNYTDNETIREEIKYARQVYNRYEIPVIDVSRRSIEETSAMIIQMLHSDHQIHTISY